MTSTIEVNHFGRPRARRLVLSLALVFAATLAAAEGPPVFTKAFMPDTIGRGSTSMLVFTIDNSANLQADNLAFIDTLPVSVTLAAPAFVSNSCAGTVSAPNAGTTITLTGGKVGAGATCTIVVNVTSSTPGTHTNTSGDLTSDNGNSGTAMADLTVDDSVPGFTKSFTPAMVPFGGRSTLTFTIDNTSISEEDASAVNTLEFVDTLPVGMRVANPANKSSTCGTPFTPPTVTANPGSSTISLGVFGTAGFPAVAAEATCNVVVDVIGSTAGLLGNVSGNLETDTIEFAGKAAAVLEVTGFTTLLSLEKEFTDDPVLPGGTVTLQFKVTNRSRTEAATGITFDDDLETTLTGLAPTMPLASIPDPPCGAGSSLAFDTGVLTLTGGTLPLEGSCTFSVELEVPAGAVPGSYPNTAGPVSGDVGGSPETGNVAGDLLFVDPIPLLTMTKAFTDDPVGAGGSVTLSFTITNNNPASGVTDLEFTDDLNTAVAGLAANGLVAAGGTEPEPIVDPCGPGSELTIFDLNTILPSPPNPNFPPDPTMLIFTGGSLAAAGMMDDSCTFEVVLDVPKGVPSGIYTNTSSEVTGEFSGPEPVTADPASGDLVVVGAPFLAKEFTDDPLLPEGGTVTLELTVFYDAEEGAPDATAIAFTDDLTALSPPVPGLVAASVDPNDCGATVDITTDPSMIDVSGGTLMAGDSCVISLTLTVPPGSPVGLHTNKTSDLTATLGGVPTIRGPAADGLLITPLAFAKEFLGDPVIAGDTLTLRFTLINNGTSSTADATAISFSDSLTTALSGLAATGAPSVNTCGGTLTGTTGLSYSGGSLDFGSSCTIEVEVEVPAGSADDDYLNATSNLTATIDSTSVTVPPATDTLTVFSSLLELTKEFTDDPVEPGDTVTLELTLENLSGETITDIGLEDDLDAALSGLTATGALLNECGGMATQFTPTFIYAGGSLDPFATCTIRLSVEVPDAPLASSPPYINTATDVAGKVGALDVFGNEASDELLVQLLTLSKSFDGDTVAGGTAVLTFTLENLDPANAVSGLAFSDNLDLVVSGLTAGAPTPDPPCGAGSALSGTSFLAFTNGSLAAGGSCSFAVTVTVPASASGGSFLNETSQLFENGLPAAAPATDFLEIEPPPAFSKAFAPDTIFEGDVSTLTFSIDNGASTLEASALDFTDNLPGSLVVATPANASTTCSGGTLTAVEDSAVVSYSGGSVAAGASCAVMVDVTSPTAGMLVNSSGDLTSSSGNSGPASDTLTVETAEADLELNKIDVFEPAIAARYQVYRLTATNNGPDPAKEVEIVDALPAETRLVVAEPVAACSEAGGVVTCNVAELAPGASFTATLQVYISPQEAMVSIDNMATVSAATTDPTPGNNDVIESTDVNPQSALVALADVDGSGFPEIALSLVGSVDVLVKDVGTLGMLHRTEVFPAGWALVDMVRAADDALAVLAVEVATGTAKVKVVTGLAGVDVSMSTLLAGELPLAMTAIPDDGLGQSLIAVASRRLSDGLARVFLFDQATGAAVGRIRFSNRWPIDIAAVADFSGDGRPEIGAVMVNPVSGGKLIRVKGLDRTLLGSMGQKNDVSPVGLTAVANCCLMPADELSMIGWDRVTTRVRLVTSDSDGLAVISDRFAGQPGGAPIDLRSVANVGGASADELAALFRNSSLSGAVWLRDSQTGAKLLSKSFGPPGFAVPLGLAIVPDAFDTAADEIAVYWLDEGSGVRRVTLRDAGSGSWLAEVPIP